MTGPSRTLRRTPRGAAPPSGIIGQRRRAAWLPVLGGLSLVVRHTALALAVSFLVFPLSFTHAAIPRILVAKVERVSDGDTVTALTSEGTKLKIRLLGIDAPEVPHGEKPGQPYGEEARDYLDHLIGGKTVRLDAYGPDRSDRILAVVWDGLVNVNLLLVVMGYAEGYRGAACPVYCQQREEGEAKA